MHTITANRCTHTDGNYNKFLNLNQIHVVQANAIQFHFKPGNTNQLDFPLSSLPNLTYKMKVKHVTK